MHFRDDDGMSLSTDGDGTERLSRPIQALVKSNQITFWTGRKSCHRSSRDPVKISAALPLLSPAPPYTAAPPFQLQLLTLTDLPAFLNCFLVHQLRSKLICVFFIDNLRRMLPCRCSENENLNETIQRSPFKCKSLRL